MTSTSLSNHRPNQWPFHNLGILSIPCDCRQVRKNYPIISLNFSHLANFLKLGHHKTRVKESPLSEATKTLEFRIKLNFPLFLGIVALLHLIFLVLGPVKIPQFQKSAENKSEDQSPRTLNIRRIGHKAGSKLNNTYLSSTPTKTKEISPTVSQKGVRGAILNGQAQTKSGNVGKSKVDLSDLAAAPTPVQQNRITQRTVEETERTVRPGRMPIVARKKALEAISLQGDGIKQFAQSNGQRGQNERNYNVSGAQNISSFQNTNVGVNLEVPEGVSPDELNEYELMYYSFQRRVALAYVNSFMSTYNRFDRLNPQLQFPMTDSQETMTGRLTYDSQGNIKQIKMIRWTNVTKLQDFFLDVLKEMNTIQNPPKTLWEKDGEFTVFFTLVVNPKG